MWHSDPMNIMGVPGIAMLSVPIAQPLLRIAVFLVTHVVVRSERVLHQVPGVVVALPSDQALHLVQRLLAGERTLTIVVRVGIPRCAEATGLDDPRMIR